MILPDVAVSEVVCDGIVAVGMEGAENKQQLGKVGIRRTVGIETCLSRTVLCTNIERKLSFHIKGTIAAS